MNQITWTIAGAVLAGLYDGLKYAEAQVNAARRGEKAEWNWAAFGSRFLAGALAGFGLGPMIGVA